MKFSKVIANLENGSTRTYKAEMVESGWKVECKMVDRYFEVTIMDENNKLVSPSLAGGGFNGNLREDLDWQPVPKYVTWQEALKAMSEGKEIRCEVDGELELPGYDDFTVTPRMIKKGIWWIE